MRTWMLLAVAAMVLLPACCWAGETRIVLREYLKQQWTNELLTYPFSAEKGTCDARSVTLTGPQGAVPVQLSEIEYWPGTQTVKTARLSFIASLAPLATDTYTVQYSNKPAPPLPTDLKVATGKDQVEITTKGFGARLRLGEQTFPQPAAAAQVPGPVVAMRLSDGNWFGGSTMYGEGKLKAYSATLTDSGPVFARVAVRYTYDSGNTVDLSMRIAAGDNTMRMETRVAKHQPKDGFTLVLSRGLPQLVLQVQDEVRQDRPPFMVKYGYGDLRWAEIPLNDYTQSRMYPIVTQLTPWEDWFGTYTQTRIRLRIKDTPREEVLRAEDPEAFETEKTDIKDQESKVGAGRELQIRSLDPGAWVEAKEIEAIFNPSAIADPAASEEVGLGVWQKLLPIIKDKNGEIFLQVNAAQGVRKWTVSDCRYMKGVAALFQYHNYKPESTFPPDTRPTIGSELDRVKDYVLEWPGDAGKHPLLFISRSDLEACWKRKVDSALLAELLKNGTALTAQEIYNQYMPQWPTDYALGAYLLSGYSPEVAEQTQIAARLRQALNYELWGMQFGGAGNPAPALYDGVIDSPAIPEAERAVLRAQMAYYAYRLADPAVWSAERGYCSGNQNMTVTWEISRGITACAIPDHPMAKVWYGKAERIMEFFLNNMVGPAGEWPEAMGGHGRTSVNQILAFAIASTNSGLHDYVHDPRLQRLILNWAKMATPRDPRPRGGIGATPNRRYFPAMGRDCIGGPGGTCGYLAYTLRQSDPALSSYLQWSWLEEGGECSPWDHLGGFCFLAVDKKIPATQPPWTSEVLPYYGAMFRHGLGTASEHQTLLYSGDHFAAFYTSHTGSISNIFAYGVPVAGLPAGSYEYQEGFLTCQVDLARPLGTFADRRAIYGYHGLPRDVNMWSWPTGELARFGEHGGLANVSSFSTLPRQDYAAVDVAKHYARGMDMGWKSTLPEWPKVPARGKPPVDWRRQVLFLKDDDPAKTSYLLIRDSIKGMKGPQPTMWQMWTVSVTLDTPEKVKDVDAILAPRPKNVELPDPEGGLEKTTDEGEIVKPGFEILPARELKGDRFTAIGQLGVDVEYYIASPTNTPRHTLRWGTDMITSTTNKLAVPEYQDLLHLQMPGDGVYYVAFFPRKRNTPAPTFSTLGDGLIIKAKGDFGTDYGFLSALETTASGEGASFKGTAASVQDRAGGLVLSLSAKGSVQYKGFGLAADFPAGLRVQEKALTVELPASLQPPAFKLAQPFPGGTVTVTAPGAWALEKPAAGVTLTKSSAGMLLKVPAGVRAVTLMAGAN
ncbi:MAG: hypothetical protein ACYC7E_06915 [Armatimonadota bacterium]